MRDLMMLLEIKRLFKLAYNLINKGMIKVVEYKDGKDKHIMVYINDQVKYTVEPDRLERIMSLVIEFYLGKGVSLTNKISDFGYITNRVNNNAAPIILFNLYRAYCRYNKSRVQLRRFEKFFFLKDHDIKHKGEVRFLLAFFSMEEIHKYFSMDIKTSNYVIASIKYVEESFSYERLADEYEERLISAFEIGKQINNLEYKG